MLKLRQSALATIRSSKAGSAADPFRQGTHAVRLAVERHRPPARRIPMGSAKDRDTAQAEFKAAWEALKMGSAKDRDGSGGVQSGLGSPEGTNRAAMLATHSRRC